MERVALTCLLFMLFPTAQNASADPVTVAIVPISQPALLETIAVVQIQVSGLGQSGAPSVSVFDLDVTYDPLIIGFDNTVFGDPTFGDQLDLSGFGSITLIENNVPGSLSLTEVSFDSPLLIDTTQDNTFILATLFFQIIQEGTSPLALSNITLGDAAGNLLPAETQDGSLSGVRALPGGACNPSSNPSDVRTEGTVEVLGTIVLNCNPGIPPVPLSVTLTFAPASIKVASGAAVPNNTSTFPLPTMTTDFPASGSPIAGLVVTTKDNAVTFSFTPSAGPQIFTITGIRANIAAAGLAGGAAVTASFSVIQGAGGQFSIFNPSLLVAFARTGLGSGTGFPSTPLNIVCTASITTPAGIPSVHPSNPDLSLSAANSLLVALAEGFPDAWRVAANEDGGTGLQGTRFRIRLTDLPSEFVVYAPQIVSAGSALKTGTALPSGTDIEITRVTGSAPDGSGGTPLAAPLANRFDLISVNSPTATIVYEVTKTDAGPLTNTITLFIALTSISTTGIGTIRGSASFAPIGPPTSVQSRPQFGAAPTKVIAKVLVCASYLLFPWVINTADGMLDTLLVISNTSADPLSIGTVGQTGAVTLYFWSADGKAKPSPATISPAGGLAAGQSATFVLSQLGIPFQGYVIAVCEFQFGHGFASINRPQPGTGGAMSQGYMALSLTNPRLSPGSPLSESAGH